MRHELLEAARALLDAVRREEADEYMQREVMDLQYAICKFEKEAKDNAPR